MKNEALKTVELYAWVGEDELGSGGIGLKQACCPAGMIPMVATTQAKMGQGYIREQLDAQGKAYGKRIVLARFKFDGVVEEVGANEAKS